MTKKRIQVYADEETKRRIELAAARYNVAVTEYCLAAIKQQLAEDDLLYREQIEIPVDPDSDKTLLADLRALQARIEAERGGKLLDVDQALQATRAERDHELTDLR